MPCLLLTAASLAGSTAFATLPDTTFLSGFQTCATPAQYCADVDQDSYGDIGYCITTCEKPYDFFALPPTDCDNNSALINPGATEVCDGVDNNCDGQVDEGNPGGGFACGTGLLGVCSAGVTQCSGGGLTCQQSVQPSAEVCDGLDNNCNGQTDEDFPQLGMACSDGGVGACAGTGVFICSASGTGTQCNITTPGHTPSAEVCDGIDNNCDGQVDEGNPGGGFACNTGLLGVCSAGATQCSGGGLICQQNVQSSAEVCDGLDNNCDGQADEGNPGGGAPCDTGVPGMCAAGTITCESGVLMCKANAPGC